MLLLAAGIVRGRAGCGTPHGGALTAIGARTGSGRRPPLGRARRATKGAAQARAEGALPGPLPDRRRAGADVHIAGLAQLAARCRQTQQDMNVCRGSRRSTGRTRSWPSRSSAMLSCETPSYRRGRVRPLFRRYLEDRGEAVRGRAQLPRLGEDGARSSRCARRLVHHRRDAPTPARGVRYLAMDRASGGTTAG